MQKTPNRGQPSTFVISHTPFTEAGDVDWDGFRAHLRRFEAAGIGVYVGGSGSGEGYSLLPDEVARLLTTAVEVLGGSVPVRAMGVEPRTARQMLELADVATAAGVDAMQIYSLDLGHLGMPRPEDLERYYVEVLDNVSISVVLSTHFSVGYLVPVDLLATLARRYDAVIGVNVSLTGDLTYLVQLLEALDPRVEVHVGGPIHALSALAMGATGYLSSEANLAPELAVDLVRAYSAGDFDTAQAAYHAMMRVFTLNMQGQPLKALQRHLGLPGGHPRPPRFDHSTPEGLQRACEVLRDIDIAELRNLLVDR